MSKQSVNLTLDQWKALRSHLRQPDQWITGKVMAYGTMISHEVFVVLLDNLVEVDLLAADENGSVDRPMDRAYAMTAAGIQAAEFGCYEVVLSGSVPYPTVQPILEELPTT